jgi:transposase
MNIKSAKKGSPDKYDPAFKRKVCEELLSGQITRVDLARKYNIPGAGTIMRWLRRYQEEQQSLYSGSMQNAEEPQNPDKSPQELQDELKLAKVKIATLETMIDIAEQNFNIEIRKKSGTKPSIE